MLYNLKRDAGRDPKGWTWLDVFPEHQPNRVQSEGEMFGNLMLWTAYSPEGVT